VELSIITITYNSKPDLELTLKSIAAQSRIAEVIVIDGGSTDGTLDVIHQNRNIITTFRSEPDRGIYDAMNKGLTLATGEWIYFLNSGDIFYDSSTLESLLSSLKEDLDIVYGDVLLSGKQTFTLSCDVSKMVIHHQGICYRKSLHDVFGNYIVHKHFTIADYFFFNQIIDYRWEKQDFVFAKCDANGVSSKTRTFYLKVCSDFLFGRVSILYLSAIIVAYPIYKSAKTILGLKSRHSA
jgi:putative colanic acid biosynthesis glycosyltransferase